MRINEITIKNFKSFKEKHIQFDAQFSLIIGDNGAGKTSILEALSIALGGFLAGIDGVDSRNILLEEVKKIGYRQGDATYIVEPQFPCSIEAQGELQGKTMKWERAIHNKKGRTTRANAKKFLQEVHQMQKSILDKPQSNVILPLISYQSAGRLFSQKREKWMNPFEKQELSRFMGYTDCLAAESNIKLFVNWLRRMTLIQLQKRKKIGELDAVLNAISIFMQGLIEESASIYYDFELEEVVVQTSTEEIPLRLMSSGYRSVIGMVADLAYRTALLNPHLTDRSVELTPGVVLIDELDLHLHPKWQWRIIDDLKRTFPGIQFIATTHAPIIMSSLKDGVVINLLEEPISNKRTAYGWQVDDVLNQVMNAENRDPEVLRKIELYEQLCAKQIYSELAPNEEAQKIQLEKELMQILPESDPALTLAKLNSIEERIKKV